MHKVRYLKTLKLKCRTHTYNLPFFFNCQFSFFFSILCLKCVFSLTSNCLPLPNYRGHLVTDKDRLSLVDRDGESLQDLQMYSTNHRSKESGLHSLGGKVMTMWTSNLGTQVPQSLPILALSELELNSKNCLQS